MSAHLPEMWERLKRIVNGDGQKYDQTCAEMHGKSSRTMVESYVLLRSLGLIPSVVFDVGVAKGTPDLYDTFDEAFFVLVEPLDVYRDAICSVLKRINGIHVPVCAGSSKGKANFNVHDYHLEGSSLLKENMIGADGHEIEVGIERIDDISIRYELQGPYLIKIDVQGAELDVLDGCDAILKDTEVVVLEVSLFKFMRGAPEFAEVIEYMRKKSFVVWDIIHGWNRPLDGALGQVDIVFVQENGMLRKTHDYSNEQQLHDQWILT